MRDVRCESENDKPLALLKPRPHPRIKRRKRAGAVHDVGGEGGVTERFLSKNKRHAYLPFNDFPYAFISIHLL
jgi:hypothetical protein